MGSLRKCPCCSEFFLPSKFARATQLFCAREACRKASKARAQRRWRQKPENRDYFCGPEQVERVRRWREQHPGYSRRRGSAPLPEPLQDLAPTQGVAAQDVGEAPPVQEPAAEGALQDLAHTQEALLVGLIATLVGEALQDKVAGILRRLVEQGQRILAQEPRAYGSPGACAAT